MRTAATPRRGQRGFSIPDVLVATAISTVALATLFSFNRFQLFALRNQAQQVDVQTTARTIVDLFSRDVRQAGMNPTCSADVQAIADAKQHRLRIQSDLDGDGTAAGPNEDITYEYKFSSDQLERAANGITDTLVDGLNLSGSRIRYFDAAGIEVTAGSTGLSSAQRANVRRIRVELALTGSAVDPQNSEPLRVQVANDIDLRNRYFVNDISCP